MLNMEAPLFSSYQCGVEIPFFSSYIMTIYKIKIKIIKISVVNATSEVSVEKSLWWSRQHLEYMMDVFLGQMTLSRSS